MSARRGAELGGGARVNPRIRFGDPHIRGVGCAAIAEHVWAGEDPTMVADEYSLPNAPMTRADVIVACWAQTRLGDWVDADYGQRRVKRTWRDRWGLWLARHEVALWAGEHDQIPDPPNRHDTT